MRGMKFHNTDRERLLQLTFFSPFEQFCTEADARGDSISIRKSWWSNFEVHTFNGSGVGSCQSD